MVGKLVELHELRFFSDGRRTPKPVTRTLISSLLFSRPTAGAKEPIAFYARCHRDGELQRYLSKNTGPLVPKILTSFTGELYELNVYILHKLLRSSDR